MGGVIGRAVLGNNVPAALMKNALVIVVIGTGLVSACKPSQSHATSTAPTALPSATPIAVRGDLHYTPIPAPAAQSALSTIRQTGEVRIGILYNDPPFTYLAPNGDIHGFDVDLLKKMADHWGVKPVFSQVTRQTRIPALDSGTVDLIAGSMPHRRELSQFVEFTDSTYQSGIGVLVANDSGINSLGDLTGRTVAFTSPDVQDAWSKFATQSGITSTPQSYPDISSAASAFRQSGGPQAIAGRLEDLLLATASLPNVKTLTNPALSEPYAFAVRRGDTPLRDFLNLTLQMMIKSGEYGQIYSADLYGTGVGDLAPMAGDPARTLQDFPVDITSGESAIAKLKRGEPLKVAGFGAGGQPVPFDGGAIVDGYNHAVINELARRWNVPVQEIPQSVGAAGIDSVQSGQADLAVGVRPDLALIGTVAFSQGYYQRGLRLIHLQGIVLLGIDDLQFKSVMIVDPLDISQDLVTKNSQYAKVTQAATSGDAFQSLTSGGTYAVVGDEFTLMLMAQADTRIDVIKKRYRATNYVMALRPGDPDFGNLVNFTLQNMKADGTLDRLIKQYFGPYTLVDDPFAPIPIETWPGDGSYLGFGGP